MALTRYQMYVQATGDTSWGEAPIWLNKQYFRFCEKTGREPHFMSSKAGYRMALIQEDEHRPFDEWLMKTYNLREQ